MLRGEIYTLQQSVKKTPKRPDDSYFPLSFSIDSTKRLCFFQRSAHDIHLIFLSSARFSLSPLFFPTPPHSVGRTGDCFNAHFDRARRA